MRREIAEILYSAMEDFKTSINPDGNECLIQMGLKPFTLVGATTDLGLLPELMCARFGQGFYLQPYTRDKLKAVALRTADALGLHDRFIAACSSGWRCQAWLRGGALTVGGGKNSIMM